MKCPNCGSEKNSVYASQDRFGYRRRNRRCTDCDFGFSTIEIVVFPHRQIKRVAIDYVGGKKHAYECVPGTGQPDD